MLSNGHNKVELCLLKVQNEYLEHGFADLNNIVLDIQMNKSLYQRNCVEYYSWKTDSITNVQAPTTTSI